MDLDGAGMLNASGFSTGRTVLGHMWLAASPIEEPIERAMLPVGMATMAQRSSWPPVDNPRWKRWENEETENQKNKLEPNSEFEEERNLFPDLKIVGIEEEPKCWETQPQEDTRERVDTSFSRFGRTDAPGNFKKRRYQGPQSKSKVSDARDRDAEDAPISKPKTRVKPEKTKLKPNDWKKLMMDSNWTKSIKEKLKTKLFASSTSATREAKRRKIRDIIDSCGFSKFQEVGLDPDQLLTVAAVLGEMGLKSADQYIGETKLMQLELGVSWSDVMERQLAMLKRALRRDRGPETRATEVPPTDIDEALWERRDKDPGVPCRVAWSYAWAAVWMLRAIEAAAVRSKDVVLNHKTKTVALTIRKSKTDQKAMGVRRTLRCCGEIPCRNLCPWNLAVRALAEHTCNKLHLFPDAYGCHVPKVKMVKAWMENINESMSGHSARRSGAMMYARSGLPVQEIAMLGRWKSACVFRYIEEAVQDIPLNSGKETMSSHTAPSDARASTEPKAHRANPAEEKPKTNRIAMNVTPIVPEEIWVVSTTRTRRVSHRVRQASWDLRLSLWDTWCGWHFADRNVKVAMTNRLQLNTVKCKKCEAAKSSRDFVKGGISLAQLVTLKEPRQLSSTEIQT